MKKILLIVTILTMGVVLSGCSTGGVKNSFDTLVDKVIEKDQQKQQGFVLDSDAVYEAFDQEIGYINLRNMGLVGVPDFCGLLDEQDHAKVLHINMMNNKIKLADQDLGCLINIKKINLSYNQIEYVKDLGSLPSLEELQLHKNSISSLAGFPDFPGLQKLNLGYNNLKDLGDIGKLKNLVSLELVHNQIEKLGGIEALENLEKLKVEYNKLQNLDGIEDLVKLVLVSAKGNELKDELKKKIDELNKEYIDKYLGGTPLGEKIGEIVDQAKDGIDEYGNDSKENEGSDNEEVKVSSID